jgi:spermidine synthase/Flp pilus assembly protein TadD
VPTTRAALSCFKLLGTIGPLLHPDPDEVFIIAVGGGIAAGATLQHPGVESVEIVDIEGAVIEAARRLGEYNHDLLEDPRVKVVINDGRNQLMMSRRKWPVIICDSTHPKSSDSWVLYTQEFYRLAREHLEEGGVFVQWVATSGLSREEFQSIAATFQSVFPHASVWVSAAEGNRGDTEFYILLVATEDRLHIDVEALERQLDAPALRADLRPYNLGEPLGLLGSFLAGEEKLANWARGVPLNTDDLPWTYYDTGPSKIVPSDLRTMASLLESPAPYLQNADQELLAKLERTVKMRQLAWRINPAGELTEIDKWRVLKMAELLRDDPEALSQLGADVAGFRGGAELATVIFQAAIESRPDDPSHHYGLGIVLAQRQKLEEAAAAFRRAVELQPSFSPARINLAVALAQTGRVVEAIDHLQKVLEIQPENEYARRVLTALLAEGNRPPR